MGTPRKPYIDDEGVRRGWYVYLHRDNASDEVFYVGMGTDRRAWDTINRNERWKQRVENLADGYSVEILEDDLTESAAGLLEARTVARCGSVGEGSPLTNIAMGGTATSIQVSLETLVDCNT